MKRLLIIFFVSMLFCGCSGQEGELDRAMTLRQRLFSGNGCSFTAEITADYGDYIYTFTLSCQGDQQGNLAFTVVSPESISGITGTVSDAGGKITFDGAVLAFPTIADGQVTPVTAPWLFLKTLRSGYIVSCGEDKEGTYLKIDDSYSDKAVHLDIWLDANLMPESAEVLWDGRRILSILVKDFTIL